MINQKSIAVLPFENLSSDQENEYFVDGITEGLINALSKIEGLNVTARTSSFVFKNKKEDIRIIGNKLGVSTIIEGSVQKSVDQLRISVQLVRTDNGFHIWSESFDRKLADVFKLQDEICLLVADKVRENFGHLHIEDHLVGTPTDNIEAYESFLKGKYYLNSFNTGNIKKGISILKQTIAIQPNYALAHVNIHYGYNMLAASGLMPVKEALDKGKKHLDIAFEINDSLPQYYHSMGWHSLNNDWDFRAANGFLNKALELNPGYADAHQKSFINLALDGLLDKAKYHIDRALELDPLSTLNNYFKAYYYYITEDYFECEQYFDRTFQFDSTFLVGYSIYALSQVHQRKTASIFKRAQSIPDVNGAYVERLMMETLANSLLDDKQKTAAAVEELRSYLKKENRERVRFFLVYIEFLRENIEESLDLIDEGILNREPLMTLLKVDPILKPLRQNNRFKRQLEIIYELSDASVFLPPKKLQNEIDTKEVEYIVKQLSKSLEEEQLYLEPNLTLRFLAENIDVHPNKLSKVLNEEIGKNFNEYVNTYRINAFQEKALLEENSNITLLGLAYDSGFNSKSVFNDSFKKLTGMTPKQWVKANK